MRFEELTDAFSCASKIVVTIEGDDYAFEKGNDKYEKIVASLISVSKNSHEMPAYCVSLDEETRKARKFGLWVELVFDGASKHNGMDFESLLIKVEKEDYAISFIRKYNGKYEGRCFHLSLDGTTKELYDVVESIINNYAN